ncbi:MAG: hypothetical protein LBR87_04800 [Synergistaceae bacterium]|nr:hypothetical protein [Synergistaceae bacterium]
MKYLKIVKLFIRKNPYIEVGILLLSGALADFCARTFVGGWGGAGFVWYKDRSLYCLAAAASALAFYLGYLSPILDRDAPAAPEEGQTPHPEPVQDTADEAEAFDIAERTEEGGHETQKESTPESPPVQEIPEVKIAFRAAEFPEAFPAREKEPAAAHRESGLPRRPEVNINERDETVFFADDFVDLSAGD